MGHAQGILRIGIYLRISQDRQGQELGVDRQKQDCRRLAERIAAQAGATARITVYTDNDISASAYSRKRREDYEALCAAIGRGELDVLVAWHDKRLIRQMRELEDFIDLINRSRIDVQFCTAGRWDLTTAAGRMQARIAGAVAANESEEKSERLKREALQHAQRGLFRGGPRPFGFEADGVTVVPAEALEVAWMCEQVAARVSLGQIVAELTRRGVATVSGRGWTVPTVRGIVQRPRNVARTVHKGVEVGDAEWPAIVELEVWRAACAVLAEPGRLTSPGNAPRWLGTNLYVCGVCGAARMRVNKQPTGGRGYKCVSGLLPGVRHVTRQAGPVDDLVERAVVARLEQPQPWELIGAGRGGGEDAAGLRLEQMQLRQRLDGLAEAFAGGEIDQRQLSAGSAKAKARVAEIDTVLASLGMRSPLDGLGPDSIREAWFGSEDRERMSLGYRRRILDMLATVTVLPAGKGRPGGNYFSRDFIKIEWK